jgi:antitoxin MazE
MSVALGGKSKRHVRAGWSTASRALADTGADEPLWPEFPNDDDALLTW